MNTDFKNNIELITWNVVGEDLDTAISQKMCLKDFYFTTHLTYRRVRDVSFIAIQSSIDSRLQGYAF